MLLSDARNVRARLAVAEAAGNGVEEANALATKRNELQEFATRTVMLAHRSALLQKQGIPLSPIPSMEKGRQTIKQINNRFAEVSFPRFFVCQRAVFMLPVFPDVAC